MNTATDSEACAKWPNRDPLGEKGGVNLYDYVANNPVNRVDSFGLQIGPGTAAIIADLAACKAIMDQAYNAAQRAQPGLNNQYTCECHGKETDVNTAMPGNGLGHCLVGYYAKKFGASKACLAAANAGFEGLEFLTLHEWWPNPFAWAYDTGRDVGQTFRGYGKDSPEGCVPSNCKKKN